MSRLVIGVTGGIGSGKTAVTNVFSKLGINIVDTDIASRAVVEPGQPALEKIFDHFGESTQNADGSMNRAAVRKLVFSNPDERKWLEELTHPLINDYIQRALESASSPYVILVSPLLYETDQYLMCNRVLVVDVPEDVQVSRTMERDDNNEKQVRAIIAAQTNRKDRLSRADDIINNDQGLDHLATAVERLHLDYLKLSEKLT
ncbi:MAG: dephospho-CoA kinase [Gammaproteobacteria bacterium]|nr:dephospho-CoA kinase [Gammaproteobacteria bacterium]|tara:strand:+ start:101 stop:709 length:609 start_codon:yes stop_codon:yes gene_type:complete